ncbi:MAG: Occludin/ELL family protein [Cyanobium sp.]
MTHLHSAPSAGRIALPALSLPLAAACSAAGLLGWSQPAAALDPPGPVVCTTTLEAPSVGGRFAVAAPVEVTRCGVVRTVPELITDQYYSWRPPFARGVSVVNQITDLFGIAMGGGREGNRVMGLGFPNQGIIWSGTAVENTAAWLLDQQSPDLPLRTGDLPSVFGGSVADPARSATCPRADQLGCAAPLRFDPSGPTSYAPPVRGLW